MNRLSKEKRDQLILVGIVTLAILAALWFLVISTRKATEADNQKKTADLEIKIRGAEELAKKKDEFEADLQAAKAKLAQSESMMLPAGNEFFVFFKTIREAAQRDGKVELINCDYPKVGETELLPVFPYKAAKFESVIFQAYYHDFGKFLADLENGFPQMQFQITSIRQPDVRKPDEPEKLRFELRIIALQVPVATR